MHQLLHRNRTAAGGCCGASSRSYVASPVVRPSSAKRGGDNGLQHHLHPSQRQNSLSIIPHAQQGPDKGSVAALEAALGAINNILGTYNKVRGSKPKADAKQAPEKGTGSSKARSAASTGPSKLVSFNAKASGNVPVKELLISSNPSNDGSVHTDNHTSSSSSSSSKSKQHQVNIHHKPKHPYSHLQKRPKHHDSSNTSSSSWFQQLTGKQHIGNIAKDGTLLPDDALSRSLQAYLSLPLEQYSVLDPRLITRLPQGVDVEETLAGLLAEQKAERAERKARKVQQQQVHSQQQQEQQPRLGAILDDAIGRTEVSSGDSSSNGTNLQPTMRQLQNPAASVSENSNDSSNNSSTVTLTADAASSAPTATSSPLAEAVNSHYADAAAVADAPDGAFLLRIPMMDLLGVDLEPLLVIYVDIDDRLGQVKFRANRLVIGDDRFDQEFKVDLLATMSSKVTQPAVQVLQDSAAAVEGLNTESTVAGNGKQSTGQTSGGHMLPSEAAQEVVQQHLATVEAAADGQTARQQADAVITVPPSSVAVAEVTTDATVEKQQLWQRGSVLGCKVKLSMTLRLPHPLSIVPGPLLSTTAGLVAKLVMQALLPSFLELLATDYGRWAAGSSTAARQALPAGSLVAAEKQPLQHVQQG